MAYTLCDSHGNPLPLRLVTADVNGVPKVFEPFTPYWWSCDPCNRSAERFLIEFNAFQQKPSPYHWYQVITTDDSPQDIELKLSHYAKVIQARKRANDAQREFERLNGL